LSKSCFAGASLEANCAEARLLDRTAHSKEVRWTIETSGIRIRRGRRAHRGHGSRSGTLHERHYQYGRKLQPPRLAVKLQVRRRPSWMAHRRQQSIASAPLQFATNQHVGQLCLRRRPHRLIALFRVQVGGWNWFHPVGALEMRRSQRGERLLGR
jgi:hypothetical protein